MMRSGHSLKDIARAACMLGLAAPLFAAEPGSHPPPIPDAADTPGWFQRQRIRHENAPLLNKANEAAARGDYGKAEQYLLQVLNNDPGNSYARLFLIDVYDHQERWTEGLALCDSLIRVQPDYLDVYFSKGFMAAKLKDYPLAVHTFEQLLARAPEDHPRRNEIYQNLAQDSYLAGDLAKAETYSGLWVKNSDVFAAHSLRAEIAQKESNWAKALPELDHALRLARTPAEKGGIQIRRGYVLYNLRKFDAAEASFVEAQGLVTDKNSHEKILRMQCECALSAGHPARAADLFKVCLAEKFDETTASGYLDALMTSEQWEVARVDAQDFLKRDGLSDVFKEATLNTIMQADMRLGDNMAYYLTARSLLTAYGKPRYGLEAATAAERLGQDDEAARLYRMCLAKSFDPKVALDFHYLLKKKPLTGESVELLDRVLATKDLDPAVRHAAMYELAQVCRQQSMMDDYFRIMNALMQEQTNPRFFREYAVQLYGAGRYEQASEMFTNCLNVETNPVQKFAICKTLADVSLAMKKPQQAETWLDKAAEFQKPDKEWQLAKALLEYQLEKYQACVDRLLPLSEGTEGRDIYHLYIGFSFYKLQLPGLALLHLNSVAEPDKLSAAQRFNFYSNRAYLQFDQDNYDAGLADLDRALALQPSDELSLARLKTLVRLGHCEEAVKSGSEILRAENDTDLEKQLEAVLKDNPDPKSRDEMRAMLKKSNGGYLAEVEQCVGLADFRLDRNADAVGYLTMALESDPALIEPYYLRGLAYYKDGRYKLAEADFKTYYEKMNGNVPNTYWADLGILEGAVGDYDLGTAALARSMEIYPYDIDTLEAMGYQYMKWNKRDEAQECFRRAIEIYKLVLPYLGDSTAKEYRITELSMKREYSKLDKAWGLQAYAVKTDYNFPSNAPVSSIDGALPSQAGIELDWRPPVLGFRDERTLDVFARILANFERESWNLEADSYQGGVGLRYKPFTKSNMNVSFERLFKIGDGSENNWLGRVMGFGDWGEKPSPDKAVWLSGRTYGEVGYFFDERRRWFYYLDGNIGPSWRLTERIMLTVPQAQGTIRYESDDQSKLLTYSQIGVGADIRVLEPEGCRTVDRWYIDGFIHYTWGWFRERPEGFDRTDFDGVVFGLSFVK